MLLGAARNNNNRYAYCGLDLIIYLIGELKEQLMKDLNWKRTTEIERIEIGPLTFKEENKRGNETKRKPTVYLIDSEVCFSPYQGIIIIMFIDNSKENYQVRMQLDDS